MNPVNFLTKRKQAGKYVSDKHHYEPTIVNSIKHYSTGFMSHLHAIDKFSNCDASPDIDHTAHLVTGVVSIQVVTFHTQVSFS